MASAGSEPLSDVPADGATKSWCIDGMAASEIEPSESVRDRDGAPTEDVEPLLAGQLADRPAGVGGLVGVAGQEGDTGGVVATGGQFEADGVDVEVVGDLDEDPGPVPTVLLASGGPPVGQVLEGRDGLADQGVRPPAVEVGHQGDPAGIMLEPRVVESADRGGPRWAVGSVAQTRRADRGGGAQGVGLGSARSRHRVAPTREVDLPTRDDVGPCVVRRLYTPSGRHRDLGSARAGGRRRPQPGLRLRSATRRDRP